MGEMYRNLLFIFTTTFILCVNSGFLDQTTLTSSQAILYSLPQHNITKFTLTNLTQNVTFVIFQVHSQYHNLSVSTSAQFLPNATVSGRHVGTVTLLKVGDFQTSWYVLSNVNKTVDVVVMATVYTEYDPVPGGCNQVYTLPNDPNLHATFTQYWTDLKFPLASEGAPRGQEPKDCDETYLDYEVYVTYMKEFDLGKDTFLNSMKATLTVDEIMARGKKIISFNSKDHRKSQVRMSSEPGQGAIYAVLVKQKRTAPYVSIATYACDINECPNGPRFGLVAVLICFCGAAGLLLCFVGHRFFKTELFILGFVAFFIIFYIIILKYSDMNENGILAVCIVLGIVGGLLCFSLWFFVGFPIISVLIASLVGGYIFSCLLFFTPFGNLEYWQTTFNFGITFACGVLILPAVLILFTKTLNILTCTFVGSFGIVLFLDYFVQSSLKYIVLNSIEHSTVPGFLTVRVTFPFYVNEIILCCIWGILFVVGSIFQFQQNRRKAPFPPCPYQKLFKRPHVEQISRRSPRRNIDHRSEERRPLLADQSLQSSCEDYQSIGTNQINRPT